MKQIFLNKEGNSGILIFFAGWGADEHLFNRVMPKGWDYLLCFDYTELDFDYSILTPYSKIRLMAWSMGVWAATQTLSGMDLPWDVRLAVNGTATPINDLTGIPDAVFRGTLDNFSAVTLAKFRRRMCGNADGVKAFLSHEPYRTLEDLHSELAAVSSQVRSREVAPFVWDKAIIGLRDKIFPVVNLLRAFAGTHVIEIDTEHYDAQLFDRLIEGEGDEWTKN